MGKEFRILLCICLSFVLLPQETRTHPLTLSSHKHSLLLLLSPYPNYPVAPFVTRSFSAFHRIFIKSKRPRAHPEENLQQHRGARHHGRSSSKGRAREAEYASAGSHHAGERPCGQCVSIPARYLLFLHPLSSHQSNNASVCLCSAGGSAFSGNYPDFDVRGISISLTRCAGNAGLSHSSCYLLALRQTVRVEITNLRELSRRR